MTDGLLDEATRLLSGDLLYTEENIDRTLRALVERVRDAENEAETQAGIAAIRTAERDAALGKLDKVRRLIPTENPELIEAGYGIDSRDVLAILDGKAGD